MSDEQSDKEYKLKCAKILAQRGNIACGFTTESEIDPEDIENKLRDFEIVAFGKALNADERKIIIPTLPLIDDALVEDKKQIQAMFEYTKQKQQSIENFVSNYNEEINKLKDKNLTPEEYTQKVLEIVERYSKIMEGEFGDDNNKIASEIKNMTNSLKIMKM